MGVYGTKYPDLIQAAQLQQEEQKAQNSGAGGQSPGGALASTAGSIAAKWALKKALADSAAAGASTAAGGTAAGATGAGAATGTAAASGTAAGGTAAGGTTAASAGTAALPIAAAIAAAYLANRAYVRSRYKTGNEAAKDPVNYIGGGVSAGAGTFAGGRNENTSDVTKDWKFWAGMSNPYTSSFYSAPRLLGSLFGRPKTQVEEQRWGKLRDAGIVSEDQMPGWVQEGKDVKGSQYRSDLPADFIGFDDSGEWVNNKFAKSRDEKDLVGRELTGYSEFAKKFGPDWLNTFSEQQRNDIADLYAKSGAVDEHHGTIDLVDEKVDQQKLQELVDLLKKPEASKAPVWQKM